MNQWRRGHDIGQADRTAHPATHGRLDKIQKNLEDYLETKRASFPRFYFLSNDELLEILAQTKNVQAVQPHLRKCFDAIQRLDFGPDPSSVDIFAMFSPGMVRVELTKNLKARGNVEDWLTNVETSMRTALHKLLKAGLLDFDTKLRKEFVFDHAGQIVATVAQMTWARDTEKVFHSDNAVAGMPGWYQTNLDDSQDLIVATRSKLTKIERRTIVALVTTGVHARDVIQGLVEEKIDVDRNFEWRNRSYNNGAVIAVFHCRAWAGSRSVRRTGRFVPQRGTCRRGRQDDFHGKGVAPPPLPEVVPFPAPRRLRRDS